jgi:hypothetical protein
MNLLQLPENIFTLTKIGIHKRAKNLCKGNFDPLEIFIASKRAIEFFTTIQETVKEKAVEQVQKYGAESMNKFDCTITQGSVYTKYHYINCNDPEYNELTLEMAELNKKIKAREVFLKGLKEPQTIVTADGEVIKIHPPAVEKTDGIRLTY